MAEKNVKTDSKTSKMEAAATEVNDNTTTYDSMVTTEMEAVVALVSDSAIDIMFKDVNSDNIGQAHIALKKFDKQMHAFVDDIDTMDSANKCAEMLGTSIADLIASQFVLNGKRFELYFDGSHVFFEPRAKYIRYSQINTPARNAIKRLALPVESLPITEFDGYRFNIGFQCKVKNELLNFRLSQIIKESTDDDVEDDVISLKYINKQINKLDELINGDESDAATIAQVKQIRASLAKQLRTQKVEEIKHKLGFDIDDYIKTGKTLTISAIQLAQFSDNGFCIGTLDLSEFDVA